MHQFQGRLLRNLAQLSAATSLLKEKHARSEVEFELEDALFAAFIAERQESLRKLSEEESSTKAAIAIAIAIGDQQAKETEEFKAAIAEQKDQQAKETEEFKAAIAQMKADLQKLTKEKEELVKVKVEPPVKVEEPEWMQEDDVETKYECCRCLVIFDTEEEGRTHLCKANGTPAVPVPSGPTVKVEPAQRSTFPCPLCPDSQGCSFDQQSDLNHHLKGLLGILEEEEGNSPPAPNNSR